MWWWALIGLFFVAVILGLFLPDVLRREKWEDRIPKRRRQRMQDRVETNAISKEDVQYQGHASAYAQDHTS